MFRQLCLNYVTKKDIYSFLHCLNLDSLDLRINMIDFGKLVETNKSLNTAFAELMRERVDEGSVKEAGEAGRGEKFNNRRFS